MSGKISSEIIQIDLDSATFRNTGAHFMPTRVNFLFGNNGTGKTTIVRAIRSGEGVKYRDGRSHNDYANLVFDQDFIDENVHSYHNLDGVFTLDANNVRIQQQLDNKSQQLELAKQKLSEAESEFDRLSAEQDNAQQDFWNDCWEKTKTERNQYALMKGKKQFGKSKSNFCESIAQHTPIQHDLAALWQMCEAAYSKDSVTYTHFPRISNTKILDRLNDQILKVVIANSAQTGLSKFLENLGATTWFREGHEKFHGKSNGRCPYCSQLLPENFEQEITGAFDAEYGKNLRMLDEFSQTYVKCANTLFESFKIPAQICPSIDQSLLNNQLNKIKAIISHNITQIRAKVSQPSITVTLQKTEGALNELAAIIDSYNKLIDQNNSIVAAKTKSRKQIDQQFFEHMAFMTKDLFAAHSRTEKLSNIKSAIQQVIINQQSTLISQLQNEINTLRSQIIEIEPAIKNINSMLKHAGFQGFEMRLGKVRDNFAPVYEVIRTETGEIAENLSEGEKNFIAFLYFQQKVLGSESDGKNASEKIVVIDDPLSGLDSSTAAIVSQQVAQIVNKCLSGSNSIKQLFVLTHNEDFYRKVSYSGERSDYSGFSDCVAHYTVEKHDNQSSVK